MLEDRDQNQSSRFGGRKPALIILRLKDERTAIVKWLKELVRIHGDDGEALQYVAVCSILPPIPDAAERKESVVRERNRPLAILRACSRSNPRSTSNLDAKESSSRKIPSSRSSVSTCWRPELVDSSAPNIKDALAFVAQWKIHAGRRRRSNLSCLDDRLANLCRARSGAQVPSKYGFICRQQICLFGTGSGPTWATTSPPQLVRSDRGAFLIP
jgi:hypothetical protein